jgi:hypothetical protein
MTIDDMTLMHLWKLEMRGENPDDFRKARKGEFLGECQEDQDLPDATMSGAAHLSDAAMCTALDEGIKEAQKEMEALGMDAIIKGHKNGDAWKFPEKYDDFNNVTVSKAMRDGDSHDRIDSATDAESSGDGSLDGGEPCTAEVDIVVEDGADPSPEDDDDLNAFEEQGLDVAEEVAWQTHTHKGRKTPKSTWQMTIPGGRQISKRTCLRLMIEAHANDSMAGLARLPKDRRTKIVSIAKEEAADDVVRKRRANGITGIMEDVEIGLEWIEPYTNIALAFSKKGHQGQTVWHGQVQRIFRRKGKAEERDGISTADPDVYDSTVTCLWYHENNNGTYTLNHKNYCYDVEQYSMRTYLGNADIEYDRASDTFSLRDPTQVSHRTTQFLFKVPSHVYIAFLHVFTHH